MAGSTRPLTLGEILDRTVQIFRNHFLLFAGISAAPSAISVIVSGVAGIYFASHMIGLKPDTQDLLKIALQVVAFLAVGFPLLLAAYTLEFGATNYAALAIAGGDQSSIRNSYGRSFRHFWRYLWILCLEILFAWIIPYCVLMGIVVVGVVVSTLAFRSASGTSRTAMGVLVGILVLGLMVVFFAVCIWVWIRFSLSFAASVSEDKSAWKAMKRSGQLSKGTRGRIFVLFLLLYILSLAVSVMFTLPVDLVITLAAGKSFSLLHPAPGIAMAIQVANLAIGFVVRTVITPMYGIALVLFYLDQRTRLEGYDIEQLMARAGWSELVPPAPPSLPPTESLVLQPSEVTALPDPNGKDRSHPDAEEPLL